MAEVFKTECVICGKEIYFSQEEFEIHNIGEPLCDEHQTEIKEGKANHFEKVDEDEEETDEDKEEGQLEAFASDVKVYIDPGHGGSDPGAVGNGLREKDIVLKIGKKMREYLNDYKNVKVRMSRSSDRYRSLAWRSNDANNWGADYFVSLHCNAGGGDGFESFIFNGSVSSKTKSAQKDVHREVAKSDSMADRGRKRANFSVLRRTIAPAVLTENGFIDRKSNANLMKKNSWINAVAKAHAEGVADAFNLKKNSNINRPSGSNTYTVRNGDTLWSIAQDHDMTVKKLKELNNLTNNVIHVGDILKVEGTASNQYVEVLVNNLWVYDKPDWDAKEFTVDKGEVFTVVDTLNVNGSKMYKLKSGLYITGWPGYVRFYTT